MVRYCMKDNGEEHFEYVHHNISSKDMNEDKLEYAKFRMVVLRIKSICFLTTSFKGPINGHYCVWKYIWVHVKFTWRLFHVYKSGQFYPNPTWVIPLGSMRMNAQGVDFPNHVKTIVSVWRIITKALAYIVYIRYIYYFSLVCIS